jgi:hypothetical protein
MSVKYQEAIHRDPLHGLDPCTVFLDRGTNPIRLGGDHESAILVAAKGGVFILFSSVTHI